MIWVVIGLVVGGFSLICLVLCQIQRLDKINEKIYFVATTEIEGIKLYMNKNGTWADFSVNGTELVLKAKEISMCPGVSIEKIGVSTRLVQEFK